MVCAGHAATHGSAIALGLFSATTQRAQVTVSRLVGTSNANTGSSGGGALTIAATGVHLSDVAISLLNSTFSGNQAPRMGGGADIVLGGQGTRSDRPPVWWPS